MIIIISSADTVPASHVTVHVFLLVQLPWSIHLVLYRPLQRDTSVPSGLDSSWRERECIGVCVCVFFVIVPP